MRFSFPWFLARRLSGMHQPKSLVSTLLFLCSAGIALGTGVFALALAITDGFDTITLSTLQSMSPDLIIRAPMRGEQLAANRILEILRAEFSTTIARASGCSIQYALLQHPEQQHTVAGFSCLQSIDPTTFADIIRIPFIQSCALHAHQLTGLTYNTIIIGAELAQQLNVTCGAEVVLRYPADEGLHNNQLTLAASRARVVGIFRSGVDEWDARGAFIAHAYGAELFPQNDAVDYISVKVTQGTPVTQVQQQLKARLSLDVLTWQDLNPMLISALKLERLAMFCLATLIMIIAGSAIMALLCMILLYHERTIAILLAHGTPRRTLRYAFTIYALFLTLRATVIGLTCATALSYFLDHYQLIPLPDMYYSSYLPAHMSVRIIVIITLLALITSLCATWYPTRRLRTLSIVEILMRH